MKHEGEAQQESGSIPRPVQSYIGRLCFFISIYFWEDIYTQPTLKRTFRYNRAVVLLTLFAVAKKQGQSKIIKRVKE